MGAKKGDKGGTSVVIAARPPDPRRPVASGARDHWLVRDPVRTTVLAVTVIALAVRFSVLKDSFFITDDFMLSARSMENSLGWDYLTRVHTGHFEPIGFGVMWLLAHFAPLNWGVAASFLLAGQIILYAFMWKLLVELFSRRMLLVLPYAVFCLTPLTMPAFTWLSSGIIWLPLMIAVTATLRFHTRYVRGGHGRDAAYTIAWFVVGLASFEKILVFLPFVVAFTLAISPGTPLTARGLTAMVRRTWVVWLGYVITTLAYLAMYLPGVQGAGNASPIKAPALGPLSDFLYLSVLRTFIPGTLGGPWSWQPSSYGLALVDSPRAFDWVCWTLFAVLVLASLALRRGVGRFWLALLVYLLGSLATLAAGRVAFGGAFVALEVRYLADAAVPLVLALAACVVPLRGEDDPWTPLGRTAGARVPAVVRNSALTVATVSVSLVSLHSLNGYAQFSTANPYREFVENAVTSLKALPASAQVFDAPVPGDLIGPIFEEYNLVSRFLAPVATPARREQMYTLRSFTEPYVMGPDGSLVPMKVQLGEAFTAPLGCAQATDGRLEMPLTKPVFEWNWAVRLGYLAEAPTSAVIGLGTDEQVVQLTEGLGEVWVSLVGAGDRLVLSGVPDGVNVCVGDAQLGLPVPAS